MEAIKTNKLTKYYSKARGIIDVDLTVNEGEFFGFIGPNGAGKSTTIRTLLGLISLTSGSAQIFGKDIVKDKKDILKITGYLPSEAIFYAGMKVSDVLKLSSDLRRVDCKKYSDELCERLQLDRTRKVEELSFGNRKKVGIVCAIQHQPKLLVLDEPTSGLDPLMQKEFFDILREQNKKGATCFISSHVLSEIQHNCGRAAIIREGKLIACDKVEALANTGAKRVILRGKVDAKLFEGAKDMKTSEAGLSFLYSGDTNALIAKLASCKVDDISISEPDLEEIFMHYYSGEAVTK